MLKYYASSHIFAIIALIIGYLLAGPIGGLATVFMLGILETTLSFDNAVVNASILKNWDEKWRKRFIRYGIPIAVFGMRFLFPLIIVAFAAKLSLVGAFSLVTTNPTEYQRIMTDPHVETAVLGFGGIFLLMVGICFFTDGEKEEHWIGFIERPLSAIGNVANVLPEKLQTLGMYVVQSVIALAIVGGTAYYIPNELQPVFVESALWGLGVFLAAKGLGALLGDGDSSSSIVKQGVGGFLYLELLDASFSFDGVIAAFALTNSIWIMMLGLGVGAMYVRSMTIHLVDNGTLNNYRYMESGAFWAIGILASIMFAHAVGIHVPEAVTGLTGAIVIGIALWSSIKANRDDKADEAAIEAVKVVE